MTVGITLFATLARYLPKHAQGDSALVEIADGSTVRDLSTAVGIPGDLPRIVLVNGQEADEGHELRHGDEVTLFPPLAGGRAIE